MKVFGIESYNYSFNLLKLKKSNYYKTKPYNIDSVSFSQNSKNKIKKPLNIEYETAKKVSKSLSNSTSGHRAPYMSETFTPEAVKLITLGVAQYAKQKNTTSAKPIIVIGGDTRIATRESLPKIKDVLIKQGIDVLYIKDPIPTPLLAFSAKNSGADISILMTASHNPWEDGGFNFITPDGSIAPLEVTQQIGKNMDTIINQGSYFEDIEPTGKAYEIYPYYSYKNHIEKLGLIDFEKIKESKIKIYYDGLRGTGTYVMPRLLDDYGINYTEIRSEGQTGPNPTSDNLEKLRQKVKDSNEKFKIGIANDGDADRFGIIDENGNFIDPNDVLLLASYHLINNLNLRGDVVRSQATSQQLDIIAQKHNLKTHITPVGFKYLASDIMQARKEGRDIIIAGEESGGMALWGHIPEKDGILADFLILDLMAKENKPIGEILKEIKENLGVSIYTDNYSKRIKDNETKEKILSKVEKRFNEALCGKTDFGELHQVDVQKTYTPNKNIKKYRPQGDGFKFVMTDGSTVLVRKSGTEPLLRFYIESIAQDDNTAKIGAQALKQYIEENFSE